MAKKAAYEPTRRVDDASDRADRARAYMARAAEDAGLGLLGAETIAWLERGSPVPEGVPDLVLRANGDGTYRVEGRGAPITQPALQQVEASVTSVTDQQPSVTGPPEETEQERKRRLTRERVARHRARQRTETA